jgi:hypothetical protein
MRLALQALLLMLLLAEPGLLVRAAASFRPPSIRDELGCSPTLSVILGKQQVQDAFFDPLKIANDDNFSRLRESELKCGRVCMLAVVETVLVPIFFARPSDDLGVNPGVELDAKVWDRIAHLAPPDVAKVVLACGILETAVFVPPSPRDLPGDYGTGWFGARDKGKHEPLLVAELEHGRLAMLALVSQVGLERWLGRPWDEYWTDWIRNWVENL